MEFEEGPEALRFAKQKLEHASLLPTFKDYKLIMQDMFDKLSTSVKNEFREFFKGEEVQDIEDLYDKFKKKIDNSITKYKNENNIDITYKYGPNRRGRMVKRDNYDRNIFKRIVKAFRVRGIPLLIEEDGKKYLNPLFDEMIEDIMTRTQSNRTFIKRSKEGIEHYAIDFGGYEMADFDNELERIYQNKLLQIQHDNNLKELNIVNQQLKQEYETLLQRHQKLRDVLETNVDNIPKEHKDYLDKKFNKIEKKLDEMKNEKDMNTFTRLFHEVRKLAEKFGPAVIGSSIISGGAAGGIGYYVKNNQLLSKKEEEQYGISNEKLKKKILKGKLNDPKVKRIREDFIKQYKDELDQMTTESVQEDKHEMELLKKSVSLGYFPKNVNVKLSK